MLSPRDQQEWQGHSKVSSGGNFIPGEFEADVPGLEKPKSSEKVPSSLGCSSSRHPIKGWDAVWRAFLKVPSSPARRAIHVFQAHVPHIFQLSSRLSFFLRLQNSKMFSAFYSFWGLWEPSLGGYRKALQTQPLMGWQGITSWHLRVAGIMMHNLRTARCLLQCKGKPDLYGSCSVVVKNKNQQQQ